MEPTREIFFNLPSIWNKVLMYGLFLVALGYLFFSLYQRFKLWGLLKICPTNLVPFLKAILFQSKFPERKNTGWAHFFVYFGFLVLVVTTTSVFIDYDLGIRIYRGTYYLAITFLSDLAGILVITLCCHFLYKRFFEKDESLISSRGDLILTLGLIILCLQGFIIEGIRIALTNDPWKFYSFGGYIVSVLFNSFDFENLAYFHFINWWAHTISVFVFFALLVYTKAFHIITGPFNLLLFSNEYLWRYKNLFERLEQGELEKIGRETILDLGPKEKLDLDACTSCGRCQEVCPAFVSQKPLSPKWLILRQKQKLYEIYTGTAVGSFLTKLDKFLVRNLTLNWPERPSSNESLNKALLNKGNTLMNGLFEENFFWACTTCMACVEACPVGINHLDHIVEARRFAVTMEGKAPAEALVALRSVQETEKPMRMPQSKSEFFKNLDVRILEKGGETEVLLWVGCISVGDKRKESILKSLVRILKTANVDFAVLGDQEICTGDPARRIGEEALFQTCARNVVELLKSFRFKTLLSHCPHCVNVFKNEYPKIFDGFLAQAKHHSEFILGLIRSGRLPTKFSDISFTIHDPCYLARYLNSFEAPRETLLSIGKIREVSRSKNKTFCCGAGGGQYFYDLKVGERVNVIRAKELMETNPDTIVTMCPFCNHMITDGLMMLNREVKVPVRDLAEVVEESL
ncbi:MAG: heterodisulfide reductase-related iron-sulfur binding cluster [Deltaproteobacteria bacterium]|nr:heterodisulfide reductase-related iron-sulfur binding cluster [Deltaproteobacteria bacterium]